MLYKRKYIKSGSNTHEVIKTFFKPMYKHGIFTSELVIYYLRYCNL